MQHSPSLRGDPGVRLIQLFLGNRGGPRNSRNLGIKTTYSEGLGNPMEQLSTQAWGEAPACPPWENSARGHDGRGTVGLDTTAAAIAWPELKCQDISGH